MLQHVEHHEEAGPGGLEAHDTAEVVREAGEEGSAGGHAGSVLRWIVPGLLRGGRVTKQKEKNIRS